jgi:four helix bundle protein
VLDYEKLDVYRSAIEHLGFVFRSIPRVPRGFSALVDQWRRAAMSVVLNIAEAVGKTSEADRSHRYAIARGEAMECGAILDVVRLIDVLPVSELDAAKQVLVRVVGMLSKLCR